MTVITNDYAIAFVMLRRAFFYPIAHIYIFITILRIPTVRAYSLAFSYDKVVVYVIERKKKRKEKTKRKDIVHDCVIVCSLTPFVFERVSLADVQLSNEGISVERMEKSSKGSDLKTNKREKIVIFIYIYAFIGSYVNV